MNKKLYNLLSYELVLLHKAKEALEFSFERCKNIDLDSDLTKENAEKLESLTSRFARTSDLIIQKIFRLFDEIDLETEGTIRDRINRASKKGLIDNADIFIEIRLLRNQISHEYAYEKVIEIHKEVLRYIPEIFKVIEKIVEYSKNYNEQ